MTLPKNVNVVFPIILLLLMHYLDGKKSDLCLYTFYSYRHTWCPFCTRQLNNDWCRAHMTAIYNH